MTQYLLDTNIISDLLRHPHGQAASRIAVVGEKNVLTSVIVAAELRYGCVKSGSRHLMQAVEGILNAMTVLAFDAPSDHEYGEIRWALEKLGKPIGGNDLLIAAHARSIGATIVTANVTEFRRVMGLNVENWLE